MLPYELLKPEHDPLPLRQGHVSPRQKGFLSIVDSMIEFCSCGLRHTGNDLLSSLRP